MPTTELCCQSESISTVAFATSTRIFCDLQEEKKQFHHQTPFQAFFFFIYFIRKGYCVCMTSVVKNVCIHALHTHTHTHTHNKYIWAWFFCVTVSFALSLILFSPFTCELYDFYNGVNHIYIFIPTCTCVWYIHTGKKSIATLYTIRSIDTGPRLSKWTAKQTKR